MTHQLCGFLALLVVVLGLGNSPPGWAQAAPTAVLTATCTAPCNAPAAVSLSATTTVAAGRSVSKVEFYDGATKVGTDTTSPYSLALTGVGGGSHSYTAKVFDNAATPLTGISAARITAVNRAPTVTLVATCGANPCVTPATVTLAATPADPDGSISKVEFYRGSTKIATKTAAPWTHTDASLAVGTYSYTAKAFDNGSTPLSTTSTARSITVFAASTAPTVALTATCTAPCNALATVSLSATATVAAGRSVSKVEFYDGATLLATDTTSPYSSTRTGVTGGAHNYTAKVYDNTVTPLTATSTAIPITVNIAPTVALTATCNASPCAAPATVTLTATPADADGSINKVEFYRGATLIATLTAAPWVQSDVGLATGGYSYTAKAFDNATVPLATTSASRSVTVAAATSTVLPIEIDGPVVSVTLPGSLPPQLRFSAVAGDVLSLRLQNDSAYPAMQGAMWPPTTALTFEEYTYSGGTPTMLFGSSVPSSYFGNHYQNGSNYLVVPFSAGHMDMVILSTGEYTIKLTDYGTGAQTLGFALMRAAPPMSVIPDATPVSATATRPGQPVLFSVSLPTGVEHAALSLLSDPAWLDPSGSNRPYYFRVLTPTRAHARDPKGDAVDGSADDFVPAAGYLSMRQPGTYTVMAVPTLMQTISASATLQTPQSSGPLVVNAPPVIWTPTRQPADGMRYSVSVVAGRTYSLFISKFGVSSADRFFSLHIEGVADELYYPEVSTFSNGTTNVVVGRVNFTATTTGTYNISLLESENPELNGPVAVSIAEGFAPVVSFAVPANTQLFVNGPYFNGVRVDGAGAVGVTDISVRAYRTGYARYDDYVVPADCYEAPVLPCNFVWATNGLRADVVDPRPLSIYAVATFSNGMTAQSADINLTRVTGPGLTMADTSIISTAPVNDDQISFFGNAFDAKLFGAQNISVFVNNIRMPTAAGGEFVVNNMPLAMGSNVVTIQSHELEITRSYVYNVERTGIQPFSVALDGETGRSPLTSTISVTNRSGAPWQRVGIATGYDNVENIVLTPSSGDTVSANFTTAGGGIRRVHITVYGAGDVKLYETDRYLLLTSSWDAFRAAKEVVTDLQAAIDVGNAAGALYAFTDEAVPKFQAIFTALGSNLASAGFLGTIEDTWMHAEPIVELKLWRGNKRFRALLVRDRMDGLWRIADM